MPRPRNKKDLIEQAKEEYEKLISFIKLLSPEDIEIVKITTKWSTKDSLAHLAEWSRMVLSWYETGLKGESPAIPREGFNWRGIPALNELIYVEHKEDSLEKVKRDLKASYEQLLSLLDSLSEQELFERSYYPWTNKNNFATYLISASSSHYKWASVRVKRAFKDELKAAQKQARAA